MHHRLIAASAAALLALTACSSGSPAAQQAEPATQPSAQNTAGQTPAPVQSEPGSPELTFDDTVCASPEFAALLKESNAKGSGAERISVSGAGGGVPAMLNCYFGVDANVGVTLFPFDTKQFKEVRDGVGAHKVKAGDEAFAARGLSGMFGYARKGDIGVRVSLSGQGSIKADEKLVAKWLALGLEVAAGKPRPDLSAVPADCAPGVEAATTALKSAPSINWSRQNQPGLTCVWSTEKASMSVSSYLANDEATKADGSGEEAVTGVGKRAVWTDYAGQLVVQMDDTRAASVHGDGLSKESVIALYHAMEASLLKSLPA